MRGAVERFAWKMWSGHAGVFGALLSLALLPLSVLWRMVAAVRARARPGEPLDGCAVVSVGNLAVGGTGKTPIASWVARTCQAMGRQTAIVVHPVAADEGLLHRGWTPGVTVVSHPDRGSAAAKACADGADVVVLDDGFQSRSVARDLDVVLLAVEDRFPGAVLPRGPYREPASALRRADVVILTRRSASVSMARDLQATVVAHTDREGSAPTLACVKLAAGRFERLTTDWTPGARGDDPPEGHAVGGLLNHSVPERTEPLEAPMALTAIARAEEFLRSVAAVSSGQVGLITRPDHHRFTAHDVREVRAKADTRPIVVTEKDAVKLTPFADLLGEAWVLVQELEWEWGEAEVRSRLAEVAGPHPTVPIATAPPPPVSAASPGLPQ